MFTFVANYYIEQEKSNGIWILAQVIGTNPYDYNNNTYQLVVTYTLDLIVG